MANETKGAKKYDYSPLVDGLLDGLISGALSFRARDFFELALAAADQAGCTVKAQKAIRELIEKDLAAKGLICMWCGEAKDDAKADVCGPDCASEQAEADAWRERDSEAAERIKAIERDEAARAGREDRAMAIRRGEG